MRNRSVVLDDIRQTGKLDDDTEAKLREAVEAFSKTFILTDESGDTEEPEAVRTQEKIVRTRPGER